MKKLLPIFFFVFSAATVNAQITVTNSTFPALGDTLKMAIDYNPAGSSFITPPGGGQVWNWSQLQADALHAVIYKAASNGTVGGSVPTASLFAKPDGTTEEYYAADASKFAKVAQYGIVAHAPSTVPKLTNLNPSWIERRSPMNFFDINQQQTNTIDEFTAAEVSPDFFQRTGLSPSSVRLRTSYLRLDVVSAWGTLTIPNGSFEVLREKRVTYHSTTLDYYHSILGWVNLDVNTLGSIYSELGLGTDTTYSYHFYSNTSKEPIAVLSVATDDATVLQAEFKSIVPAVIPCLPITDLQVLKTTDSSAKLSWVFPDTSVTNLKIMYRVKDDPVWNKARVGNSKNGINLTGLLPATYYQWKVQTLCKNNSSLSDWVKGPNFKTSHAEPSNTLSIYPNPVTGNLITISFVNTNSANNLLNISDLQGESFINEKLVTGSGMFKKSIDVSALPKGIYVLKVTNEKGSMQQIKFVKEN